MAHFVIGAAIVIGAIWAFVAFRSFRIVVGILALIGIGAFFVINEQSSQTQKNVEAKKEQDRIEFATKQREYCEIEKKRWMLVPASEIEVREPQLAPSPSYRATVLSEEFTATATIKNNSKSKVTTLRFNITALDCPTKDIRNATCDVVGRADKSFQTDIPAGEVRQIDGVIKLRDVPKPRGAFSSKFAIAGVRAAIDQSDDSGFVERFMYTCD